MWTGLTPSVDHGFKRKLRDYDPDLDCVFDRQFGKFVVTQSSKVSGRVPAVIIGVDVEEGYRQPDDRDIRQIAKADFARKSVKERIKEGEDYMREYRENQNAHVAEEIRDSTKDDKIQLMNAYRRHLLKDGKANSEFRRITPKSKGKKF